MTNNVYDEINSVWDYSAQEFARQILTKAGYEFKNAGSNLRSVGSGKICIYSNGMVCNWAEGWSQRDPVSLVETVFSFSHETSINFLRDFLNINDSITEEQKYIRKQEYNNLIQKREQEQRQKEEEWNNKKSVIFNNFIKEGMKYFTQDSCHYYSVLDYRGIPCEYRERKDVFYTDSPLLNCAETKEGKKFSIPRRSIVFINKHDMAFKSLSLIDETDDLIKEYNISQDEVKRGHKIKQTLRSFGCLVYPHIEYKTVDYVVFVESEFDALLLQGMGITAQANKTPFNNIENFLNLKFAFAFYDNDDAGQRFTDNLKTYCDLLSIPFFDIRHIVEGVKDVGDFAESIQKDQIKLADLKSKIRCEVNNKIENTRIHNIIKRSAVVNDYDFEVYGNLKIFSMSRGQVLGVRKDKTSHEWFTIPLGGDNNKTIISINYKINQITDEEYFNEYHDFMNSKITEVQKQLTSCSSADDANRILSDNFPKLFIQKKIVRIATYIVKNKNSVEQHFKLEYNEKETSEPFKMFVNNMTYYTQTRAFSGSDLKVISNDPTEDCMFFIDLDSIPDNIPTPTWDQTMKKFVLGGEEFKAFVYSIFCAKSQGRQAFWLYDLDGKSGKSSICDAIQSVFPQPLDEYVGSIDSVAVGDKFTYSKYWNKRLAVCADCKNQYIIKTEFLHKLLGSDLIDVEYKGKDSFSAIPQTKVLIASNLKPKIDETARHETSRVIPVILSAKGLSNSERDFITTFGDSDYKQRLKDEMLGFLGKCKAAYQRLCPTHTDIKLSKEVADFLESCSDGSSEEAERIIESCFVEDDGRVLASTELKYAVSHYCSELSIKTDVRTIENNVRNWFTKKVGEPKKGFCASGKRVMGFKGWTLAYGERRRQYETSLPARTY